VGKREEEGQEVITEMVFGSCSLGDQHEDRNFWRRYDRQRRDREREGERQEATGEGMTLRTEKGQGKERGGARGDSEQG
jgi:hypothetical protein